MISVLDAPPTSQMPRSHVAGHILDSRVVTPAVKGALWEGAAQAGVPRAAEHREEPPGLLNYTLLSKTPRKEEETMLNPVAKLEENTNNH